MLGSLTVSVSVLAVLLVRLIAGLLVGTAIEQKTLGCWTRTHGCGHGTARMRCSAGCCRGWWNGSLLLLFFAAYLHAGTGRWMFLAAGLLLLTGIVVTLVVEVPINKQVVVWQAGAMLAGWAGCGTGGGGSMVCDR